MNFLSGYRLIGGLVLTLIAAACTKPETSTLVTGKPVFQFDYESVSELFISKKDPGEPVWTARLAQEGWLGPQQVTPRWVIREAPEGTSLTDLLVDGSFIRHLLDNLRTLRKTGAPLKGTDASFGLAPEWTRLAWKQGDQRFELFLGAPAPNRNGRFARIGEERLIVDGAALDMLNLITGFDRVRHRRLITWTLDDVDRMTMKWLTAQGKPIGQWSAERFSGDWARPVDTATGATPKPFKKSPDQALEALAHLQIQSFDLPPESFGPLWLSVEWLDRKDHRMSLEIDHELRARCSDRPNALFRLHEGARAVLSPKNF